MNTTGIDAIAFYVPKPYVSMDNLSTARGISAEKLKRGLGLEKMAVPILMRMLLHLQQMHCSI